MRCRFIAALAAAVGLLFFLSAPQPLPAQARRVADLMALRGAAQAENDRRVARVGGKHAILVAPRAGRHAPGQVRPVDELRRDEQLDPLVAHPAKVVEARDRYRAFRQLACLL